MTDVKLLPCPFCGGKVKKIVAPLGFGNIRAVECSNALCAVTGSWGRNESEAIAAWNTRAALATIPDPSAYIAAARGMREALEACQSTLQHTRAFMLQTHGTTNPAREDALADTEAALRAFDAAQGEQ